MKKVFLYLFLLAAPIILSSQDIESYTIEVEFFPEVALMYNIPVDNNNYMQGVAAVKFNKLDREAVTFYLHGELHVDSVLSGGGKIEFNQKKDFFYYNYSLTATIISLNSKLVDVAKEIVIYYSGFINPSRARSLSDYMQIDKEEGVFLRSYGYSLWFPVYMEEEHKSYKADFKSIKVNLPAKFKCVITGKLANEFIVNNRYTTIWQPGLVDISDIQCTARAYNLTHRDNVFVYYVNDRDVSERILEFVHNLKEIFAQNLRKIDDENPLFVMEMPLYGDISSSNVVGISESNFNSFVGNLNSKLTIAHELVHPYVKIPVSEDNPFYALVVEGFPSFFQVYALEKVSSEYDLKAEMKKVEERYLTKRTGMDKRGRRVPEEKPILNIHADEIGTYKDKFILNDRVWLFLFDLWQKMGDENFDLFLKDLFVLSSIDYPTLENIVLNYLPDYGNKFNIWLNTTSFPESLQIQ
jgi:hypothetical protein